MERKPKKDILLRLCNLIFIVHRAQTSTGHQFPRSDENLLKIKIGRLKSYVNPDRTRSLSALGEFSQKTKGILLATLEIPTISHECLNYSKSHFLRESVAKIQGLLEKSEEDTPIETIVIISNKDVAIALSLYCVEKIYEDSTWQCPLTSENQILILSTKDNDSFSSLVLK